MWAMVRDQLMDRLATDPALARRLPAAGRGPRRPPDPHAGGADRARPAGLRMTPWSDRDGDPCTRARRPRRRPARRARRAPPRRARPPRAAHHEHRTTARRRRAPARRRARRPRLLPGHGADRRHRPRGPGGPGVALRADLDALPVPDATGRPYASTAPGVGARLRARRAHRRRARRRPRAGRPGRRRARCAHGVRLVFQPAEEVMPGGALDVIARRGARRRRRDLRAALRPQPRRRHRRPPGRADHLRLRPRHASGCSATGGHTSRPHLAGDLVFALGQVVTQLPAVLARRVDPRAGRQPHLGRRARRRRRATPSPRTGVARAPCAAWRPRRGSTPASSSSPSSPTSCAPTPCAPRSACRAACRRSTTTSHVHRRPRATPRAPCSAPTRSCPTAQSPGRGGLRLVPAPRPRRDGAAGRRAPPAGRPTTCTAATTRRTRRRLAVGIRLLVAAASAGAAGRSAGLTHPIWQRCTGGTSGSADSANYDGRDARRTGSGPCLGSRRASTWAQPGPGGHHP